jgi:Domain of unknown function (DUF4034)
VANETCVKLSTDSFVHYCNATSTTRKISTLTLLLVFMSGLAFAADQKSDPNPCNISEDEAVGMNGDFSTDIHAARNYGNTIARILKDERFEELDCLADRVRSGKERFPGGAWKLHTLYGGVYSPIQYPIAHATQDEWNLHLPRLQRWITARPKSVTARVALALAYLSYAWDARGNGYSNTVSESGWKLFEERTAEAQRILDEAAALPTKCPEWYVAMQGVAVGQSWDAAEARALFEKATKFEPGYYYYAQDLASYLLPKWSGEAGDTEKFAQETADRIGGGQGDILYFRVAASVICGCDDDPHLSIARIERGFEASEKQYGVSMLNLNFIAFLTARYPEGDMVYADKALNRIAEQWDEQTWKSREAFEQARSFAASRAPVEAKRRAMETAAETNMQTPEGHRYEASFEKTYRKLVRQCVKTEGGGMDKGEDKFETLTSVGARGMVEDVRIYSRAPVAVCVYQKLHTFEQKKATPFSPPPRSPYWIRLDLNWADFAPIASK